MPPLDQTAERGEPASSPCLTCDLGDLAFCAGLSETDSARLAAILGHHPVKAHETVFREGDPAAHLFSIAAGAVKLYKLLSDGRRQITAFLFPGDFFGLDNQGFYAYTAETLTTVSLCRFPRKRLDLLFEDVPRLEKRLLTHTINELSMAHEQMLLLGRKTAREKVASFLLMIRRRTERSLPPNTTAVPLPMSRSDIADYLGLTIETVSRILTQLKKEGVIGLPDVGHVVFKQTDQLARMAEGG